MLTEQAVCMLEKNNDNNVKSKKVQIVVRNALTI